MRAIAIIGYVLAGMNGSLAIGFGLDAKHGSSGWHLFLFCFLVYAVSRLNKVRRSGERPQ